jgi:hypothetical protein
VSSVASSCCVAAQKLQGLLMERPAGQGPGLRACKCAMKEAEECCSMAAKTLTQLLSTHMQHNKPLAHVQFSFNPPASQGLQCTCYH